MKNFLFFFLLSFFVEGVFGESLSVKEGGSVTLHTGLTKINNVLEWRFGAELDRIAIVRKDREPTIEDDVLDGIFRDRLKPDRQTGDLTITNITTNHTGPYEISINTKAFRTFSVSVVSAGPVKSVSLMVGDSVTLNTGVPEPQRYDVIQWRSEHLNSPIAEINRKTRNYFTSNTDERFKDRLQLDYWSGSLTIKNTENKHDGDYEVDISTSMHTIHKSFTVTVRGKVKSGLSVKEGESVTLNSDLTEIQTDDLMQWMFEDSQIAEIYKADDRFSTSDVPDGTFRGRLKLDHQTGSLTITNTRTEDSGEYELKISNSRPTIYRIISVTVTGSVTGALTFNPGLSSCAKLAISVGVFLACGAVVGVFYHRRKISKLKEQAWKRSLPSVMEGETIILKPDEVHKDEHLVWIFRGSFIAERENFADSFTVHDDVLDGRFRGRLKLDDKTGSLTITNTRNTDSGEYELLISSPARFLAKRFSVSVVDQTDDIEPVSVKEGESVTLKTGVDMQKVEQIQWKSGLFTPLVEIRGGTKKISPLADKIFQGRLEMDRQTGSLTIKKIRPKDAGIYMQYIIEEGNLKTKLFRLKFKNKREEEPLRSVDDP